MITFEEYLKRVCLEPRQFQRFGQLCMNVLGGARPDLYETVTSDKDADPFHDDEKLPAFFNFVQENW